MSGVDSGKRFMDVYYSQTKGSMDFIADNYLLREYYLC